MSIFGLGVKYLKMKIHLKVFASCLFLFSWLDLYSHPDTLYLSKHKVVVSKHEAVYYRIKLNKVKDKVEFREYYFTGELAMQGFLSVGLKENYDGLSICFYKDGKIKSEGNYNSGRREGKWKFWYDNGQIQEEVEFVEAEYPGENKVVLNSWNREGELQVKNGFGGYVSYFENNQIELEGYVKDYKKVGQWKGYRDDGSLYFEEVYSQGKLVKGVSYDSEGNLYSYTKEIIQPEPKGGIAEFVRWVGQNMTYPRKARWKGIEGKVYVRFFIDKQGRVTNVEAAKGIGGGCDEEAVRVIQAAPDWQPGYRKGQPEDICMILPITFKLD
jgi:TonB family protein